MSIATVGLGRGCRARREDGARGDGGELGERRGRGRGEGGEGRGGEGRGERGQRTRNMNSANHTPVTLGDVGSYYVMLCAR